jgi:hypothetical protein
MAEKASTIPAIPMDSLLVVRADDTVHVSLLRPLVSIGFEDPDQSTNLKEPDAALVLLMLAIERPTGGVAATRPIPGFRS